MDRLLTYCFKPLFAMVSDTEVAGTVPVEEAADVADSGSDVRTAVMASIGLAASGIAGRVALQHVPSVEPIIAVSVLAGLYGGWRHGFGVGAFAFLVSNFMVWGGQGPWTVFQVAGAGLAGAAAGITGKVSRGWKTYFASLLIGVTVFEIIVNAGSLVYMSWALPAGIASLIAAVPFAAAHFVSTIGFGSIIYGFSGRVKERY